jgi:hypothetical protein
MVNDLSIKIGFTSIGSARAAPNGCYVQIKIDGVIEIA